jgi:tetratricopeptide (TPR) repeat protein
MFKFIIKIFLIVFFVLTNQSCSRNTKIFDRDKVGNDGKLSIINKTSIAKHPLKNTNYKSAKQRILKAKKFENKGKYLKAEKLYNEALKYLYKANKKYPFNPDILNYLGFVNRKMNKIEDAEIYFVMGLELSPNHLSINEYLGELYVATNRIDLAKERLNVLKDCNCEEYNKLKKIIEES